MPPPRSIPTTSLPPVRLLISTPRFVLEHCTRESRTRVLESGRGEYYGISWSPSGSEMALSHSHLQNDLLQTADDYQRSEVGTVSVAGRDALQRLSAPHQILWIGPDHLVATNTGRNSIVRVDVRTGATEERRVGSAPWDRLSAETYDGVHLNSLFVRDSTLYVLANNFDKGSFVCEFSWPDLELRAETPTPGLTGLHNLFVSDDGSWIVCDSYAGGLADGRTGRSLWDNRGQGLTRGLAATADVLLVGHSEKSGRSLRTGTESGVWVVDARSFETLDYLYLGHFGCVHEVRIADEPDLAHHGRVLADAARAAFDEKVREHVARRLTTATGQVHAVFGGLSKDQDGLAPLDGGFYLGLMPPSDGRELSAEVQFDTGEGSAPSHAGLVTRYRGPGDRHMVAAIFELDPLGNVTVGFWTNDGVAWVKHAWAPVSSSADAGIRGSRRTFRARLRDAGDVVAIDVDGRELLSLARGDALPTFAQPGGRCGIRMYGPSVRLREPSTGTPGE